MQRTPSPTSESDDDSKQNKGLDLLIEAAIYLENCDNKRPRESDHGYASTFKFDDEPSKKRMRLSKKSQSRTSHNELEKNRLDLEARKVGYEQEKDKLAKYNEHLKEMLFRLEIKFERFRRDSTGSTSLSDCSSDSDKDEIIDVLDTSCSSGDELIQVMAASNEGSIVMGMPEILIAST